MHLWILALSRFFHIMGTVVWIGGILMTLLVILPSSKVALASSPMAGKFMKEVTKRFTPLANLSIVLLIATGVILFFYDKNYTSFSDLKNHWNVMIILKHFSVATMILLHVYRGLILNRKIQNALSLSDEKQSSRLKKVSLGLVQVNLALGLLVLLLTAVSLSI